MKSCKTTEEFFEGSTEKANPEEELVNFIAGLPDGFTFTESYNYLSMALHNLIIREMEYKFGGEQPYSAEALSRYNSLLMALRKYGRERPMCWQREYLTEEKKAD